MTRVTIRLTSFNGHAELYASKVNQQPGYGNAEYAATSLSAVLTTSVDVTTPDFVIYVGVTGLTQTQYGLKVDAVYTNLYPQTYISVPINTSTTN